MNSIDPELTTFQANIAFLSLTWLEQASFELGYLFPLANFIHPVILLGTVVFSPRFCCSTNVFRPIFAVPPWYFVCF